MQESIGESRDDTNACMSEQERTVKWMKEMYAVAVDNRDIRKDANDLKHQVAQLKLEHDARLIVLETAHKDNAELFASAKEFFTKAPEYKRKIIRWSFILNAIVILSLLVGSPIKDNLKAIGKNILSAIMAGV